MSDPKYRWLNIKPLLRRRGSNGFATSHGPPGGGQNRFAMDL